MPTPSNPSNISTQALINRSMRVLGLLASGEVPTSEEANDALIVFNQMVESWSIQNLLTYTYAQTNYTWPATQASQTIGPTGDIVTTRPIEVLPETYYTYNQTGTNVDFTLQFINLAQYNSISVKSIQSTLPQWLYYQPDFPNATIYLYPVPMVALPFHIFSRQPLLDSASLSTLIYLPPGYSQAMVYGLACLLGPEYGVPISPDVKRIADTSLSALKAINRSQLKMSLPAITLSSATSRYNFFTDTGR